MRTTLPISEFSVKSHTFWNDQWLLLAAGDFSKGAYNCMTVSWGGLGTLWNRPIAVVVVRPTRYTYQFIDQYDSFSLSSFAPSYKKALALLGSKSGRDGDKIAEAGLTPIQASRIAAPAFAEAALTLECRKLYWDDLKPEHFLDASIDQNYSGGDYHRLYIGEILEIGENKP